MAINYTEYTTCVGTGNSMADALIELDRKVNADLKSGDGWELYGTIAIMGDVRSEKVGWYTAVQSLTRNRIL